MQHIDLKNNFDCTKRLCSANQFSVAPMLDWTDKHCRYFHRQLSSQAWLYSEMVTTGAIIYGDNLPRFLGHFEDNPVVLQLGGSNSKDLAKCAKLAEEWGYSEINLNIGCPSDRVQNNMIGACLMAHPKLVAENIVAIKSIVNIPVTVKCRIGIDDAEDFTTLVNFVAKLEADGVDGIIIHARKAWLQGLSPKQNREIPPLRYDWVHRIKQHFPHLSIAINGGIKTIAQALTHRLPEFGDLKLPGVDGAMLGRAAYETPYLLAEVDQLYYEKDELPKSREVILESMYPYIENHLSSGGKLNQVSRHMLGLFHALPGGRIWRRTLSEEAFKAGAGIEVLMLAYKQVSAEIERMHEQSLKYNSIRKNDDAS